MNTKTTINIDGIKYELDLQRAKQLGIIEECKKIKDFEIGDLFAYVKTGCWFVIVEQGRSGNYAIIGLGDSLRTFSDCGANGYSTEQMLEFLNSGSEKFFVKNINEDFADVVKLAVANAQRG